MEQSKITANQTDAARRSAHSRDGVEGIDVMTPSNESSADRGALALADQVRLLLGHMRDGALLEDENRRIAMTNQLFCDMFRIPAPPEALVGTDCSAAAEQSKGLFKDPDEFIRRIDEILEAGEVVRGDLIETIDGVVLERDYVPFREGDDDRGRLWLYRDATAREEAKVRLAESERRYRDLVGNAADVIYRVSPTGEFTFVNHAALELTGYDERELLGMNYLELIREDWRDRVQTFYRSQLDDGEEATSHEFPISTKTGEEKWVGQRARLVRERGEIVGMQAVARDITERKRYEERLRLNQANLTALIENTEDLIVSIDLDYRVLAMNTRYQTLFEAQFGKTLALGDSPLDFVGEIAPLWKAMFDRALGGERFREELPVELVGRTRVLEVSLNPIIRDDGDVTGASIYMRDITDVKESIDELLDAKARAEESTKAKQRFLAHMSHEIRTPMNAVLGLSHLLLEMNPTPEQRKFIDVIRASADNLLVIINDVLDFSKIEAGKIEFSEDVFPIRETLERAAETVRIMADGKNLRLDAAFADAVPDYAVGDDVRLTQVALNLLSNAVKFTNEGSVEMFVDAEPRDEKSFTLHVRVKDSGIGIPDEQLDKVFASFEQIASKTAKKQTGTGLGLSIVKRLVEMQGGSIFVSSEPGVGTTFAFALPFRRATEEQAREAAEERRNATGVPKGNLEGARVLVVEDNEMNRLVAANMLALWGAEFESAEHGGVAIEKLKSEEFDLILMDLSMPVLDGYETTRKIREEFDEPIRSIPILALTASALLDSKEKVFEAGMNGFVPKPFKPAELRDRIAEALGRAAGTRKCEKPNDATTTNEEEALDFSYLREISGGSEEFMREMVVKFLEQTPDRLQELKAAIEARNAAEVKRVGHRIKPTFAYMGAEKTRADLEWIERSAERGVDIDEIAERFAVVEEAYPNIEKQLRNFAKQ
jgi:PAS domain S-box-containing protein